MPNNDDNLTERDYRKLLDNAQPDVKKKVITAVKLSKGFYDRADKAEKQGDIDLVKEMEHSGDLWFAAAEILLFQGGKK